MKSAIFLEGGGDGDAGHLNNFVPTMRHLPVCFQEILFPWSQSENEWDAGYFGNN